MIGFFKLCQIDMQLEEITGVIREVTKDPKRNYLTYKDIKGIIGKDNTLESRLFDRKKEKDNKTITESDSKSQVYQSELEQMLSLLSRANNNDLFRFFREYDPKCKWVNDFVIQRVIKQSIRMPDDRLKNATESMWSTAGIPAENKQNYKLKYIVLLKQTKQYEAVKLFKMVLT